MAGRVAGENGLSVSRRTVFGMLGASAALPALAMRRTSATTAALAALERKSGGRLGVAILDTAIGRFTGHRIDERFGMCSTFKLPLTAAVLWEIESGRLRGDTILRYGEADMIPNSPVTRANLANGGMSVLDLAKAAQQFSDNTAANLLIAQLDDPAGVTAKLRLLGDPASRLDRYEPAMNLVLPGEVHDTTTPRAMALGMRAYLLGRALRPASRDLLTGWMVETKTGAGRLRAGFPPDWRAGDKTGSSWNETTMVDKVNDVAIVWPPRRAPIIVTAYLDGANKSKAIRPEDETILAEVGRIVARNFSR